MPCFFCGKVQRILGWSKAPKKDNKVKTAPVSVSSKKPGKK